MENIYGTDCKISYVPRNGRMKKAFTFTNRFGEVTIIGRKKTQNEILSMMFNTLPTFDEYIEAEKQKQAERNRLKGVAKNV